MEIDLHVKRSRPIDIRKAFGPAAGDNCPKKDKSGTWDWENFSAADMAVSLANTIIPIPSMFVAPTWIEH